MRNEKLKEQKNLPKKINALIKDIEDINSIMIQLNIPEKVLEKEVKIFGNGCHVILPKEYANKNAKIIINNKQEIKKSLCFTHT